MPVIKNKLYKEFLQGGFIDTITEEEILRVIEAIDYRAKAQAQALVAALWVTGARPGELLELKKEDVTLEQFYIKMRIKTLKKGVGRTLTLPKRKKPVKIMSNYFKNVPPGVYLFWSFRKHYFKDYITKEGHYITNIDRTGKLKYYIKKWFAVLGDRAVPTYYLRHNRFSIFAEKGASIEQIRQWKGGRSVASVFPYLHMSSEATKKTGKLI